jgi:hypothetical protein
MRHDLPRNSQGTALLGDPRNDENIMLSQFHVALMRFHNRVVQDVKDELGSAFTKEEVFSNAQRIVRWHYQWMVLNDFLRKTVGDQLVDDVLRNKPTFYTWRNDPYIPVEFSVGAVPLRALPGPSQLPVQLRHERDRRRPAVLRHHLRPEGA